MRVMFGRGECTAAATLFECAGCECSARNTSAALVAEPRVRRAGFARRSGERGRARRPTPTAARLLAWRVLDRVEREGAYADLALHSALARSELSARDRAFATELVYGTLRWRGRLDFLLAAVIQHGARAKETTAHGRGRKTHASSARAKETSARVSETSSRRASDARAREETSRWQQTRTWHADDALAASKHTRAARDTAAKDTRATHTAHEDTHDAHKDTHAARATHKDTHAPHDAKAKDIHADEAGDPTSRALAKLDPPVRTLLRLGAYQLLFSRVPASAAVDQTVRCARAAGLHRAAGFVNAVLRGLSRRAGQLALPELADAPLAHLEHALGTPRWIAERWLAQLGPEAAAALARASNEPPPQSARVNPLRGTRDALLAELRTRRADAARTRHAPGGVQLGHHGNPESDPALRDGRLTIQDEASQLIVALLDPQPGEFVLDLCAAPGAKATAIAECVGPHGRVLAVDKNPRRLALVERACRRLGLDNVLTLCADLCDDPPTAEEIALAGALEAGDVRAGAESSARAHEGVSRANDAPRAHAPSHTRPIARILLDAPCTGLGALRRNPDARWRLTADDPARLAALQAQLLARAASLLPPGAVLVYSTCTVTPEENENVVRELLARDPGLALARTVPAPLRPFTDADGFVRTWPHRHGMDGFFAARIERRAPQARAPQARGSVAGFAETNTRASRERTREGTLKGARDE